MRRRDAHPDHPLTIILGWPVPAWVLTAAPVAFVFLVGAAGLAAAERLHGPGRGLLALGLVANLIALSVRYRGPLVVLGVTVALSLALGYGPIVVLPILLAVYTVAEYTARSRLLPAAVIAAGAVVGTEALHGGKLSAPVILTEVFAVSLAVAAGLYLRARADYITGLRDRAERLERERELLADRAVGEERVRIARELHDVIAHNVSLMVVQAQALAATGADGEQAQALGRIADRGREALSEMHRMLGVLRPQDAELAAREPQPGVRDLPALVERAREAGLQATLTITGTQGSLPAAVDLSVYRIAQEALTNVIRHAAAQRAIVTLTYLPDAIEVMVLDDGAGSRPNGSGDPDGDAVGGHGLVGMRERVALFGGSFEAGDRDHGPGYRVRALIPVR